MAERIDQHVQIFRVHRPYRESDHVLAQVLNLYVGGTCLEDVANLQHSEAVRRIIGACRIPDPTTGGDFLRRLREQEHQPCSGRVDPRNLDRVSPVKNWARPGRPG